MRSESRSSPIVSVLRAIALAAASVLVLAPRSWAQDSPEINANGTVNFMDHVGVDQRLGEDLDLELRFRDESGRDVRLGEFFDERPVLLVFAYYECPMLCTLVLNGTVRSLRAISDLDVGEDYQVVVIGIDPAETSKLAAEKKQSYVETYARKGSASGWHFLTGEESSIRALAEQSGFRYVYDEANDEYAHAAAIMIATPSGRLSSYFYGVEFVTKDVRLGLIEAGQGSIGSFADRVLLLCYHYDPAEGKYGLAIMGVMRLMGGLTVLGLITFVGRMLWRDRHRLPAIDDGLHGI